MRAGDDSRPSQLLGSSLDYLNKSFRWPFFSFMVPRRWSERPSDFFTSSPLRAPAASLRRPLALSTAPSRLSSPEVLPRLPIKLLLSSVAVHAFTLDGAEQTWRWLERSGPGTRTSRC